MHVEIEALAAGLLAGIIDAEKARRRGDRAALDKAMEGRAGGPGTGGCSHGQRA
ncbi:MAG: hypothetical protein WKF75_03935 [Singulisphaera sp.]